METLTELLTPVVEVVVGRARWNVMFTHRALLTLERLTGKSTLLGEITPWSMDSAGLKAMLESTYGDQGIGLDLRGLTPRIIPRVISALQRGWENSMPLPSPSDGHKSVDPGNWTEAWANAHQVLHMTSSEWLGSTPRMVQALSLHRLELTRQREWMIAQVAWGTINFGACHPRDQSKITDYMLHPWDSTKVDSGGQSVENVLRDFMATEWVTDESRETVGKLLGGVN